MFIHIKKHELKLLSWSFSLPVLALTFDDVWHRFRFHFGTFLALFPCCPAIVSSMIMLVIFVVFFFFYKILPNMDPNSMGLDLHLSTFSQACFYIDFGWMLVHIERILAPCVLRVGSKLVPLCVILVQLFNIAFHCVFLATIFSILTFRSFYFQCSMLSIFECSIFVLHFQLPNFQKEINATEEGNY